MRVPLRQWAQRSGPCREYESLVDTFTVYEDEPEIVVLVRTIVAWGYVHNTACPVAFLSKEESGK